MKRYSLVAVRNLVAKYWKPKDVLKEKWLQIKDSYDWNE